MYKKWLLVITGILLVLVIGAGCSNKDVGGASPSATVTPEVTASADTAAPSAEVSVSPSPSVDTQKPILDAFQTLLKTPGNEKEVIAKIRQDVSKLSPENANQMILDFEAYQTTAISNGTILSGELIKLIQSSAEPYYEKTLNDLSKITNDDLKKALQDVFNKGYKIIIPEGNYEAVINYDVYLYSETYVTPDIAAYIEIMSKESDSRMLDDAAIVISVDEVFSRALASENFVMTYHDSVKYDQVMLKYAIYVDTFFFGQNNTPAFDYFTKKLNQEFLDSYEKVAQSGKNTPLVEAVTQYLKIIKENDYTLTTAVIDFRKSRTDGLKNTAS